MNSKLCYTWICQSQPAHRSIDPSIKSSVIFNMNEIKWQLNKHKQFSENFTEIDTENCIKSLNQIRNFYDWWPGRPAPATAIVLGPSHIAIYIPEANKQQMNYYSVIIFILFRIFLEPSNLMFAFSSVPTIILLDAVHHHVKDSIVQIKDMSLKWMKLDVSNMNIFFRWPKISWNDFHFNCQIMF